jgi:putative FmdB family regulatory protein
VPIFEYRCKKCGEVFEQLVRAAGEVVACPSCASRSVAKLLSVPSAPRTAGSGAPPRSGGGEGGGCCSGGGCGCHN